MREHINAEKSSSNVHKDRDIVDFSAEGRNMCYEFRVPDIKDRAKHTVVKPGIAPLFDTVSRTLKAVREEKGACRPRRRLMLPWQRLWLWTGQSATEAVKEVYMMTGAFLCFKNVELTKLTKLTKKSKLKS